METHSLTVWPCSPHKATDTQQLSTEIYIEKYTHTLAPPYFHVFQVLYAFNHVFLLSGALCCTLGQSSPSGCWTLVVFIITVWET